MMDHSFQRLTLISVGSVLALIGGIAVMALIIGMDRPAQAQVFTRDGAAAGGFAGGFNGEKGAGGSAGQRPPPNIDRIMKMDRNGDGLLAPDEMPERARERLSRADADGDGMVSRAELETVFERMKQMRAEGGIPGGKPPGGFNPGEPSAPAGNATSAPPPVTAPATPYIPGAGTTAPADDAPILPGQ